MPVLYLALLLCWSATSALADTLRIASSNLLPSVPPYSWFNYCTGKPGGYFSLTMDRLVTKAGHSPELVLTAGTVSSYTQVSNIRYQQLVNNELDLIILGDGPRLDETITYGKQAILTIGSEVVTHKDGPLVSTIDDLISLDGVVVASNEDDTARWMAGLGLKADIVEDISKAMNFVAAKQVDYAIVDPYQSKLLLHQLGIKDQLHYTGLTFGERNFYIVARAEQAMINVLDDIDKKIIELKTDGYLKHMLSANIKLWLREESCASKLN